MKIKKLVNITTIVLLFCIVAGIGVFIYDAKNTYRINNDFIRIPLKFNPYDSSSSYEMQKSQITVYGGFIKGIQKNKDGSDSIVIRALSPLPTIEVEGNDSSTISLMVENINPELYAKHISNGNFNTTKVKANTLQLNIEVHARETVMVEPLNFASDENMDDYKFIILGDNRDGYDTFEEIIQQINGLNPAFVIDNGDLVFSGKPNQYRLFDKMTSNISTTLLTTLGNHDIQGNGRSIYTMIYGPAYYSFDFGESHFVFLDSSPGWAEKQSISDEQYEWLEKDLIKAQGKRIFAITHIPPQDPRSGVTPNEIPNYMNKVQSGENWLEKKINNYSESKSMDHGFQDPIEAAKFENLMSKYHVDTVYLSHIHSYLEYTKDSVRYLITGGAGAELLTKNSYYHYIIARISDVSTSTIIALPSPANNYMARYAATIQLFANAMYEENPITVILVIGGLALLLFLLIVKIFLWKRKPLETVGRWLYDIIKFAVKRFRELFLNKK